MKLEPGMAYNTKTLNKVFAFLSVLFLMVVLWMMFDDYIRPWKGWQIKGLEVEREVLAKKLGEFDESVDKAKLDQILKDIEEAKGIVRERTGKIEEVESKLSAVKANIQAEKIINGEANANVSELLFRYETKLAHKDPSAPHLKRKLDGYRAEFADSKERLKRFQMEEKQLKRELSALKEDLISSEKRYDNLMGARDRLEAAFAKTNPKNPVWVLRNLPFIDFMDPTLKVHQIVLENVTDDRYFQHVPKVDRCITCHMFIDKEGYEDQEQPFKTHPNLDLVLGVNSPHPINQIGCTTCHGGEGHRVNDFQSIAHTPSSPEQRAAWEDKYHWHEPHKIAQPMFKLPNTEAACIKCHRGVEHIPGGTVVNKGLELMEEKGCYGCHVIPGYEHKVKPGPSLKKIASKIDKEFFKKWVWNPRSFNKHAKMPSFFGQTNNSKPVFMEKNIVEVNTMAEYLFSLSEPYSPFKKYTGGNVENGKELVSSIGCLSCHGVEGIEASDIVQGKRGPYLTGLGSKHDGDWLVSWLKKPSHFQEDTIMPSFRLTDKEANDIAAFLLSSKNKTFDALKFEELDRGLRDELLIMYFTQFDTLASAQKKLSQMNDRQRTLELGKRSVGKYGCYSCHAVEGMENRAPIGPSLAAVGSKPVEQFGFGHEPVEHKRDTWLTAHLQNPRRWDNGTAKGFNDLNRMPHFYLSKEEIQPMVVALLGQVSDRVPLAGVKRLDSREVIIEKGRKIVNKYNCMGCHQINGRGGDLLKKYIDDDINEGPPRLVNNGHRVKSEWFHYFLNNVHEIRPWLKVRMPSFDFTNDEVNAIVAYFQAESKQVTFEELAPEKVEWKPGERQAAIALWNEFACVSCHSGGFNNEEQLAPNLHYAKGRLRDSWIKLWLKNPQAIMPGTSMPSFWEDGESQAPGILGGDVDAQIDALAKYIQEMGYNKYHEPLAKNEK